MHGIPNLKVLFSISYNFNFLSLSPTDGKLIGNDLQPDGSRPFTVAVKMRTGLRNNTVYVKPVTSQLSFRHEQIFFMQQKR